MRVALWVAVYEEIWGTQRIPTWSFKFTTVRDGSHYIPRPLSPHLPNYFFPTVSLSQTSSGHPPPAGYFIDGLNLLSPNANASEDQESSNAPNQSLRPWEGSGGSMRAAFSNATETTVVLDHVSSSLVRRCTIHASALSRKQDRSQVVITFPMATEMAVTGLSHNASLLNRHNDSTRDMIYPHPSNFYPAYIQDVVDAGGQAMGIMHYGKESFGGEHFPLLSSYSSLEGWAGGKDAKVHNRSLAQIGETSSISETTADRFTQVDCDAEQQCS